MTPNPKIWQDPFPDDVPLDINVLATYLQALMYKTGFRVSYDEQAKFRAEVFELLEKYDGLRTRHIKFLRDQLIEMHNRVITPYSTKL